MAFIALKPCSFGGEKFLIGDTIATSLVRPEMIKRLKKMGILVEAPEPKPEQEPEPEPESEQEPEPEQVPEPEPKPKRAKNKKSGEN